MELLLADTVGVQQLDYGSFTTLRGSLKKMLTKMVIREVGGDRGRRRESQMVAGKTELDNHLFDKISWLHAFLCILIYDLSFWVTKWFLKYFLIYYLFFPLSVLNVCE